MDSIDKISVGEGVEPPTYHHRRNNLTKRSNEEMSRRWKGLKFLWICLLVLVIAGAVSEGAHARELSCKETFWGEVVCQTHKRADRSVDIRYTIKTDIWGDEVVRENGKVVARCKQDVFGTQACRGVQR